MATTAKPKTERSRVWLEEHDYVQQNTWIPRELRDQFTAACAERGLSKRGVLIDLLTGFVQREYQAGNSQEGPEEERP